MISVQCPSCKKIHSSPESLLGKTVRCNNCQHVFVVSHHAGLAKLSVGEVVANPTSQNAPPPLPVPPLQSSPANPAPESLVIHDQAGQSVSSVSGNLQMPAREDPDALPARRGWDRVFKVFGILLLLVSGLSLILGIGLHFYGGSLSSSGEAQVERAGTFEATDPDYGMVTSLSSSRQASMQEGWNRRTKGDDIRHMGGGLIWYGWRGAIIASVLLIAARYAPRADSPPRGEATKKCPFCAERIKAGAKICRYCARDLRAT